ncbi:Condensation domain-containing protein [Anaerovibrio lipolyticus DSM 3074]|uniref:Condensation domain-containing protein n=1 Tax=Anaerovibrio lipolyticus DSM 3074 TaxID=1120997 RepID=A0A1M6DUD6_9FIRM|nr:condensation domain-containing protein [Anaerovibrio lipolyticus]SHI76785.1 Condensation domain-containing protein [Anaerovibrio lipolyticus DSM 3074]
MAEKMLFSSLPTEYKASLVELYNQQENVLAHNIKYLRELSTEEKGVFSTKGGSAPVGSVLQIIYKISGKLLPLHFNVAVDRAFVQEDILRTNYVLINGMMMAVVKEKRNPPLEIVYHNLKDLSDDELDVELQRNIAADKRLGFDLTNGQLVRFSVFNTGEDEYAIIVTTVEAVALKLDFHRIFRAALKLPQPEDIYKIVDAVVGGNGVMTSPVKNYWEKMLSDLPPMPKIPHLNPQPAKGKYSEEAYLVYVPRDILSDLRSKAESNKLLLMSMLQTAWGLLLQQSNSVNNVSYCLLVPQKKKSIPGAQSLVPFLLKAEDNPTVKTMVNNAFKQFVVSQPYASLGREDIINLLGKHSEPFDHFLNFYDFLAEPKPYSKVKGTGDGTIVSQKHWDVRDVILDVSFRNEGNQVIISVDYNGEAYLQNDIAILLKHYLLVLQQMLTDWNEPVEYFIERLKKRWEVKFQELDESQEDSRSIIQDALSRIALFQECEQGIIQLFVLGAKLYTKFEGDRISEHEVENQLVFVLSGKVARSIECGDGWYNTLDILKGNSWINENVMLPKHKVKISAEVITEQATILVVPLVNLMSTLKKSPLLAKNIIYHVMRQLEKYQRLWIQS